MGKFDNTMEDIYNYRYYRIDDKIMAYEEVALHVWSISFVNLRYSFDCIAILRTSTKKTIDTAK